MKPTHCDGCVKPLNEAPQVRHIHDANTYVFCTFECYLDSRAKLGIDPKVEANT